MNDIRKDKRFTLVEIPMAVFIGLILLGAVYVSINSGQRSAVGIERKVAAQQNVRAFLQTMGIELSMASYDPNYIAGIWQDIPAIGSGLSCTPSVNQTYRGIREAIPTAITVETDLGESNKVGHEKGGNRPLPVQYR